MLLRLDELTPGQLVGYVHRAYQLDRMNASTRDPIQMEAVARWLDAHPHLLELVWQSWLNKLPDNTEAHDAARFWLDQVFLGGIAAP